MGFLADWFTSVFLIKLDFQLGLMVCSCTIKNGMVEREDSQPETSLDYMVRPCLKIKQNHKNLNIVRKCVDKPYKRDSLKMNKVVPSGYSLLGRKWQSLWWGNLIEKIGILLVCLFTFWCGNPSFRNPGIWTGECFAITTQYALLLKGWVINHRISHGGSC